MAKNRKKAAKNRPLPVKEAPPKDTKLIVGWLHKFFSTPWAVFGVLISGIVLFRLFLFYGAIDDPYMQFRVGDEAYYHEWALRILNGKWAHGASFFTTPLYAYFLAFVYYVGGQSLTYVRLLNVILGIGTIFLTYLTARKYMDYSSSLIATFLLGFCTAPIFYEWFPEKTSLVMFLTAASFYMLSWAATGRKSWTWLAAGWVVGLGCLAHALLLLTVPAAWIHIFRCREKTRFSASVTVAIFITGIVLGVLPATIHNYLQDGDFVLICSNAGQNFYTGNHSGNVTGDYVSPNFAAASIKSEEEDFKREAEKREQRIMKPSEVSSFWLRQGLDEIKQEPGLALTRFWHRLRWAVGADAEEPSDTRTYAFYLARYRILNLPFPGFGFMSSLGLTGLLLTLRDRNYSVLNFFMIFFILGMVLFIVYGRYRLPLLIPVSILAAVTLSKGYDLLRQKRTKALLGFSIIPVAIFIFLHIKVLPGLEESFFPDYYNQGNHYLKIGQKDLAVVEYEKALTVRAGDHPGAEKLYGELIDHYLLDRRYDRAEEFLNRAVALYPDNQSFRDRMRKLQTLRHESPSK